MRDTDRFFAAVFLRDGAFFRLTVFFAVAFFLEGFFLVVFFLVTFFRDGFFLVTFFLATFFLDGFFLLTFFRATFFLATFFLVVFFFATFFFTGAFFRAAAFFLVTFFFEALPRAGALLRLAGFFLATFFFAFDFFDAGFLRDVAVFFRFLLAAFFAGILYSCRGKKRPGLYMASGRREELFRPERSPPTKAVSGALHAKFGPVVVFWQESFYCRNYITLTDFYGILAR